MKLFQQAQEIQTLMKKELNGSLTIKEKEQLDQVKNDSRIRTLYEKFDSEEYLDKKFSELLSHNPDMAFAEFYTQVNKRKSKIVISRILRIAAAILIPLLIGVCFVWMNDPDQNDKYSLANAPEIKAANSLTELVLDDGEVVKIDIKNDTIEEKNGVSIQSNTKKIVYESEKKDIEKKQVINTIRVSKGGEQFITLSDGTKVWLNSESELTFPVPFSAKNRVVSLKGEIYLEVAKDAQRPFYVNTSEGQIKVLGTSFNVKAYPEESEIYTTLVEGKVQFSSTIEGGKPILLEPGYQAILRKGQTDIQIKEVDTQVYIGWKNGLFSFRRESLHSILRSLARWYDIEVFFDDDAARHLLFTGDLGKYESINPFLEMIQKSGMAKFKIVENAVIVSMKK